MTFFTEREETVKVFGVGVRVAMGVWMYNMRSMNIMSLERRPLACLWIVCRGLRPLGEVACMRLESPFSNAVIHDFANVTSANGYECPSSCT